MMPVLDVFSVALHFGQTSLPLSGGHRITPLSPRSEQWGAGSATGVLLKAPLPPAKPLGAALPGSG